MLNGHLLGSDLLLGHHGTLTLPLDESSSPPGSFVGMIPSSNRFNEWPEVWMVNSTASRRSGLFKFQVFDSMTDEVFLISLSSMVQRIDKFFSWNCLRCFCCDSPDR